MHHRIVGLESEGYTRTQAEQLVADLKAAKREQAHGINAPKRQGRLTVATAVPDYLDYLARHGGRDIDTKRRRFAQHVVPILGSRTLAHLTDDDWTAYVAARRAQGASPGTINRERSALLHLLNTAVRRRILRGLPCLLTREKEPPGKLVYLTPEQSQRLLQAAQQDPSPHAHPFVMIALFTGMRHTSVLNLRARDVDADRRVLWVGQDKAGRREQPMPRVLADYLREMTAGMAPDAFLFASPRAAGGRLYQANAIFARCVERAGSRPRGDAPHAAPHRRHERGSCRSGRRYNPGPRRLKDASDGRAVHPRGQHDGSDGCPREQAEVRRGYTGIATDRLRTRVNPSWAYSSTVRAGDS